EYAKTQENAQAPPSQGAKIAHQYLAGDWQFIRRGIRRVALNRRRVAEAAEEVETAHHAGSRQNLLMTLVDTTDHGGVPAFLDRRPFVGTYSNLHTFRDVCEEQFQRRYIKKDQPYVESPEMAWGNKVHEAFEKRVGKGQVLPDDMRQWEHFAQPFDKFKVLCEQKWGMNEQARKTGYFDSDVY